MSGVKLSDIYKAASTTPIDNAATGNPNNTKLSDIYKTDSSNRALEYSGLSAVEKTFREDAYASGSKGMQIKGASEMFRLMGDNWIPVNGNSTADYQNSLAANQSTSEVIGNLLSRMWANTKSGLASSFDIDIKNMWDLANGRAIEHTSELFEYAKKTREDAQIENPLYYNTNMEFGSRDYFTQIPDALSYSFARMGGDYLQQAALTALTAATFGASAGLQASVLATKIAKYAIGIGFGAFKGLQETKDNALETREAVYNEYRSMGVEHDEAMKYANEAAHLHFKMESIPLIALNALQFGMIKTSLPGVQSANIGSYSNVVETLGKFATKGIKSKGLSGVAETGIQMLSEGFEEGMQAYFGKLAEDEVMRSSGHRGMFVDFNPMDQEMGLAIISGALGGGMFQGMGKVFSSINSKHVKNINTKLYDDVINNTAAEVIKYNTALQKAMKEEKYEEAANIRYKMHKKTVYDNLAFDIKMGDERAFNTYLSTLTEVYSALEKNDTEVLKKYGVQNTPDNKEFFKDLIDDTVSIKEKFDKSYKKYENFDIAANISHAMFEMEKSVQTKKRMISKFNTDLESEYNRLTINSQRVKDLNTKLGEFNYLSSVKRTEPQQKRYEQLQQEIAELETEEFSQEEVVELKTTEEVIEQISELHRALDNQDKRFEAAKEILEKLESYSGRKEYIKKKKEREVKEAKEKKDKEKLATVVNQKDTAPDVKESAKAGMDNITASEKIQSQSPSVEGAIPKPASVNPATTPLTDSEGANINPVIDEMLAALEQGTQENISDIEAKRADIERRRQEELDKYWDRQLRQIPEKEREREVKRVTTDIINARKVADKFLSLVSTKSVDEFHKWINENPYDAYKLQNELEEHYLTKDLWKYGFDRTFIPYGKNTIDEYLYNLLTTDVDKINAKYDAELAALEGDSKSIIDEGAQFSPKTLKELTEEQKSVLKNGVERIVKTLESTRGKKPSFNDLIKILVDTNGKEWVDERFEALAKGFELAYGLKLEDKINTYLYQIQGLEGAIDAFESSIGDMFAEEQSQGDVQSGVVTLPPTPTNPNTKVDKTTKSNTISPEGEVIETKDDRVTDSTPKGAYLSLPYRIKVIEKDGKFFIQRITNEQAQLEENQRLNVKYALSPNNLLPGTTLSVKVPDNVQNYLVTLWDNYELSDDAVTTKTQPAGVLSKRTITFGEWEKLPGNQKVINGKLNPKWVAKVPMVATTNGESVFYIHDNEWYNPNNISDFKDPNTGIPDFNRQRAVIEEARRNLNNIRLQAFQNNGATITITEKTWGHFTPLGSINSKGVMPISEVFKGNTDQVTIGTVKNGIIIIVKDGKPIPLSSAYPNATIKTTMDFGSGTMVEIRQGSTPNSFHVFQAYRSTLSQDSVENISNILKVVTGQLGSAQNTLGQIEELIGTKLYNSQGKVNHEAVLKILSKYLRIGISENAKDGTPFVSYFAQGDYIRFGRKGQPEKTLNLNNKTESTNLQAFVDFLSSGTEALHNNNYNPKVFGNYSLNEFGRNKNNRMFTVDANGNMTPGMFYEDFIKTQLKTNIAAYNIGTEEKPDYITFTQPRLNYTFGGVITSQKVEQKEMTAQEVKDAETANGIDTSQKEIPVQTPASVIVKEIQKMKDEAEKLGEATDEMIDAMFEKAKKIEEAENAAKIETELAPIMAISKLLQEKGFLIPC